MKSQSTHTAILLFAQTSRVDTVRKSFASGDVVDVLNNHVLKTVIASGLDYFHCTEQEQRGNTFAARFSNAIQDVFNAGYESVICIGNDTPSLTTTMITRAASAVQSGAVAMGKSVDGGLYLLGINRDQFALQRFKKLPWCASNLANAFTHYVENLDSSIVTLKILQDIDNASDLKRYLSGKNASETVVRLLLITLSRKRNNHTHPAILYSQIIEEQPANKGSPYLQTA